MQDKLRPDFTDKNGWFYQLLMQAEVALVIYIGKDHVFEFVNPKYCELVGRPADQLLGKPVFEALPEVAGQGFEQILGNVYLKGEPFEAKGIPAKIERRGKLELGYFNTLYKPFRNNIGEIIGIIQIATEVTELVEARNRAEANETSFRIALEAGKMGTWHLDLLADTSFRSLQHDHIFGYQELLNKWGYEDFLSHVLPKYREEVTHQFEIAKVTGELHFETRILRADNKVRWIAVKGKTYYSVDGKPSFMAGVVMDIEDRKLAEEQMKELTEELAASNEELVAANEEIRSNMEELSATNDKLTLINSDLDSFIYTASHDLKAPISNIEGLMSLLVRTIPAESLENDMLKQTIGLIDTSIDRFKRTIEELTNIAKLQKEVEEASLTNLAEVVEDVQLDLFSSIDESGAKIEVNICDSMEVQLSYKNLKSIVHNLLSNAIKYRNSQRDLKVRIACSQEGDYQVFEVEDNGLGMKEKDIDKIFSMFRRLHTHVEGSGVGLYLVKRIVNNMGGKLKVESEEGKGTLFRIWFPIPKKSKEAATNKDLLDSFLTE